MHRQRTRSKTQFRASLERLESRQVLSTLTVSPTGSDTNPGTAALPFKTLQHAADSTNPGDTVDVKAGTYAGFQMGWNRPQSGLPGKPITFSAEPGVTINSRNNKTSDGIDLEGSSYITVQGFTVVGMGRAGIRAVLDHNVIIKNNVTDLNTQWGIYTSFSDHVIVDHNVASRSAKEHGIYIANGTVGPVVTNNTVWGNANCGIHMNGDGTQGGSGIITGAVVTGNIITNNGRTGGAAINCDGVQNSLIANNILNGNVSSGIALFRINALGSAINNVVANNTIIEAPNSRWAININSGSTGNQLYNNILLNKNTSHGSITITSDSLAGFKSDNNVVSQFNLDGANLSLAAWQKVTGQDTHSFVATIAQVFADPTLASYGLAQATSTTPTYYNGYLVPGSSTATSQSPAINAGINLSQYFTTDVYGTKRPAAPGRWDIGAVQHR